MAILMAINEVNPTIPGGTTPGGSNDVRFDKNTTAGRFDSDYSRASIKHPTGSACTWTLASSPAYDTVNSLWLHMNSLAGSSQDVDNIWIRDGSGDLIYGIEKNSGTTSCTMYARSYNDAQAETVVSEGVTAGGVLRDFDWHFDIANDEVKFYVDGVLEGTHSIDLNQRTGGTLMVDVEFDGDTPSDNYGFSQLIVVTEDSTIGWKVKDLNPDGAGNHTDWTGAYTDVNENLYDPTAENTIAAAGSQSYTYDDVQGGIQTGQEIKGVCVSTVAAADASAAAPNVQNFVRTNATDYNLGSPVDVEGGDNRSAIVDYMTTNPDTGSKWTFSEINAAEFGFKSSV